MHGTQGCLRWTVCATGVVLAVFAVPGQALSSEPNESVRWIDKGWAVGVHAGRAIKQSLRTGEAFLPYEWEFKDYYVTSIGLRKEMFQLWRHSRIFTEVNMSWITGDEEYAEAFITPTITWDTFPWDHVVDTTAALGVGVSYTTKTTELDQISQRWTASMIVELDMQPASWEHWSVYTRIHHRSNAGGVFGDDDSAKGSNFPSLGVRYQF